ncbi:THO complex subunit 1 transcription elongation factor-domain-containing protein [Lineolata rhizophorae]|uniref:THO complex subunit 1 transcription elongation factor-domain-containing protein n=1 Tax=Lineolata rhizophorae TaxID=578093 RepID=A0A6A6P2J6_9PEZI|nr:THO complex subunit 1 transcription elongation factor-domain-containing protein [Lineolata rhizophorae]
MTGPEVASVEAATVRLEDLLGRARRVKQSNSIEPPLPVSEFASDDGLLAATEPDSRHAHNAVVETAARNLQYNVVAHTNIEDPAFVKVWNLLDILQILGDRDQCDPALVFWLVEDLLDSQSIDGCRKVFDYLESRRERLVTKDFQRNKHLVVLRSCNDLLRRLSRAEDAVFCGRVFVFLFQCFPLGDRSSVNLRGEFHTENVTTFEETPPAESVDQVDVESTGQKENGQQGDDEQPAQDADTSGPVKPPDESVKITVSQPTASDDGGKSMDTDKLYPVFWTLQEAFSDPRRLFSANYFAKFKAGLEATIAKFKEVPKVLQAQSDSARGVKRSAEDRHDEFASTYNPKYLTSRDLFKLELSDLAFQRHILVQTLILIDFLLSLTEKSKKRLAHLNPQRVLQYNYVLSEQDAEWALGMKATIANYLQEGPDGKFYYRMVDTVLSRDKNWVRWKLENCPPITQEPASSNEFLQAADSAQSACANKRMRPTAMGALDLKFLSDPDAVHGLEGLKARERYAPPPMETFTREIENLELDLDFAEGAEREALLEKKNAKTWATLRVAAKTKLSLFDKVEDGKNLSPLVEPNAVVEATREDMASVTDAPEGGRGESGGADMESGAKEARAGSSPGTAESRRQRAEQDEEEEPAQAAAASAAAA